MSLSRGRKLTVEGAQSLPKTVIGRVTCSTTLLVLAPVGLHLPCACELCMPGVPAWMLWQLWPLTSSPLQLQHSEHRVQQTMVPCVSKKEEWHLELLIWAGPQTDWVRAKPQGTRSGAKVWGHWAGRRVLKMPSGVEWRRRVG